MTLFKTGIIALAATLMLAAPAAAGTKDDIRDLQARLAGAEQALAGQSQAILQISQLERQIQDLTGEIEELRFQLDQANTRLDAVSAVLAGDSNYTAPADFNSTTPGGGPVSLVPGGDQGVGAGDPIADQIAQAGAGAAAGDASDVALPLDPNAAFDYASGFLLAGDYGRAKSAFTLYVEAFPNHPRTADAQFRLGEIHLALGENAAAADAFIAHIRSYPNDQRAAEAYLKLGTAFARLDKSTEACTVFKTMKSKHPNAPSPVIQRADLEMSRINCN